MLKNLEIALAEEGYLEKATNKNLDDKTANAGFNNWTKYARDLDNIGFFNTAKNGYPWCAVFTTWTFYKAWGAAAARLMTYQPTKSSGAGCTQAAAYYKSRGQFYNTPKVGDQIFFTWGGEIEHTGLVYHVDSTKVYTIEGNTNGKSGLIANGGGVYRKSYERNSSVIYGYGRPNYGLVTTEEQKEPTEPKQTVTDTGVYDLKIKQLKKGATGNLVKTLQALLIKKFSISLPVYGVDGDFGAETLAGVKVFQKRYGLTQDGVVGEKTWAKLLGI